MESRNQFGHACSGAVYFLSRIRKSSAAQILALVVVLLAVPVAKASWSCAPWTGDADSGITSALDYPVAVNTSGDAVTVNGVTFQADAASGTNFSIAGDNSVASSAANINGNSQTLANAFRYGGSPLTVTLSNLTSGVTYETTFFSYGWDAAGTTRIQTFATDSDSVAVDQNLYGQGNGIWITCTFVATASSKVFTITPSGENTFHLSALANRKVTPATILGFGTNVSGSTAVIGKPVGGVATIAWTVPYSVNLATLAPSYSVTSGTGTPASANLPSPNFSAGSVTYKIRDGAVTNSYTVTAAKAPANTACDLLAFNPNLAGSRVTVMSTGTNTGTVVVSVPAGTTNPQLAALTPTLTLSPCATCVTPTPPLSLTAPVHYIVRAENGVTSKDYTATVMTNAAAFRLFVVQTATKGLASSDYDYLTAVPASRHNNNGAPAVFAVASTNDFTTNIYLKDYLRRYRPTVINTINFSAAISNYTSTAITAAGPLELSVSLATNFWSSSARVVLVSDAVTTNNYPNVLQASALASALNVPLLYYNAGKESLVQNAITCLGATEVIYVNVTGTKPAMASLVLTNPTTIVNYLAGKGITVDYFAVANPTDLNLVTCAKLSLTAPFVAARRTGIVVPLASWACNTNEAFHYTGYPLIKAELGQLYQAIGRYPSYLALVGSAHSIPLSYRGPNEVAGNCTGSPADLDYAEVDADVFPDIAIGRIMAYDIFDASLLTSRISTYEQLFDGVWEKTMADVGGAWNSAYQDVLGANYGFTSVSLMQSLGPTQPVEASIIGHNDHSSQHTLGGAFNTGSANVLAPATIFSDGCATAAIDIDVGNLLVVNQLFKLGAVAFVGSTRSDPGPGKMKHSAALNALFAGEPLGRCYRAGVDTMTWNGADDQRWNWIFLGDPGLTIYVPSVPVVAPASHGVSPESSDSDILTVTIPSTVFTAQVDQDWCNGWGLTSPKYWGEKAGLYGMDVDRFYLIRQTITRPVVNVEELEVWTNLNIWVWGDVKLGMFGQPMLDYQQDGTTQLVWAIRANIMDWAGNQRTIPLATMTNATFRICYSSGVTTNSSSFRCAPWTGDADSGITSNSTYTVAVNCQGDAATVNGVAFEASTLSGTNFSISGEFSPYDGSTHTITGDSSTLANDFIYDGNPYTVTLLNLTPGKAYETTFFSFGWEDSGRTETFASGNEACIIDQDTYGAGNGIRVLYTFVATSSAKVITITPAEGSVGTFHLCALANREVILPDTTPPAPDPMSFAVPPGGLSVTSIVMTATTAVDAGGASVSYYFENTNTSVNSGWMPCTVWTNTGLIPSVTYGYRVMARDALSNATCWSTVATAKPLDLVLNVAQSAITNFVFSWPVASGFRLQMRTNLMSGTWIDYPGGHVNPIQVSRTHDSCFFRLIQQ